MRQSEMLSSVNCGYRSKQARIRSVGRACLPAQVWPKIGGWCAFDRALRSWTVEFGRFVDQKFKATYPVDADDGGAPSFSGSQEALRTARACLGNHA